MNCNIKVLMEEKEKHHKSKITSDDKKEADLLEYATWKKVFKHIDKAGEEFKEGNGPIHL